MRRCRIADATMRVRKKEFNRKIRSARAYGTLALRAASAGAFPVVHESRSTMSDAFDVPDGDATPRVATWDVARIRADFPALAPGHDEPAIACLDGPAGSLLPAPVLRAVGANAGPGARRAAQAAFADWLGGAADDIVLGPSMTALALQAGRALAPGWRPGDNVVVTQQDHCANTDGWRAAAAARGIEVRCARVRPDGSLDLADLDGQIDRRTRLVAFPAASNVIGTINDVPLVASMARRKGAMVFVDAVHFSAHRLADAARWDCDFLACSAYKFYGPRVSALWVRTAARAAMGERGAGLDEAVAETDASGAVSPADLAAVQVAVDYLAGHAEGTSRRRRLEGTMASLAAHESGLVARLWEGLARNHRIRLLGPAPDARRTATVAFSFEGMPAQVVCERLAGQGLRVGSGHFNARPLVRALGHGPAGLVRAGCMMYSTRDEVDRLIGVLADMAG
jgi:cysteine desulfurase family protein (TIGR01976 family)